jgi:hypothetical protein
MSAFVSKNYLSKEIIRSHGDYSMSPRPLELRGNISMYVHSKHPRKDIITKQKLPGQFHKREQVIKLFWIKLTHTSVAEPKQIVSAPTFENLRLRPRLHLVPLDTTFNIFI